ARGMVLDRPEAEAVEGRAQIDHPPLGEPSAQLQADGDRDHDRRPPERASAPRRRRLGKRSRGWCGDQIGRWAGGLTEIYGHQPASSTMARRTAARSTTPTWAPSCTTR